MPTSARRGSAPVPSTTIPPVIATSNTGGADLIEDNINGFIIPIRDYIAIKDKIELIEKDFSLNLGLDWLWKEKNLNHTKPSEASFSIGQVVKFNNDLDMPTKSSLQNKNSDLVTKATYLSPSNFDFTMKNTLDNNLNHAYYNDVTLKTFLKPKSYKGSNKFPDFKHNDMKANNILVTTNNINKKWYLYNINHQKYYIPIINIQIQLWDFDFSCIKNIIENSKVNTKWANASNITSKRNRYYDIHYFFNSLITSNLIFD